MFLGTLPADGVTGAVGRGLTITLAHHAVLHYNSALMLKNFNVYLACTIVLGITFLLCQWVEYTYGISFRWTDNVYGSVFFITTGFHGFHVLLGTYGLLFCLVRSINISKFFYDWVSSFNLKYNELFCEKKFKQTSFFAVYKFSPTQHLGFEAALWYWHFVDVVWIFLFCVVYWWSDRSI